MRENPVFTRTSILLEDFCSIPIKVTTQNLGFSIIFTFDDIGYRGQKGRINTLFTNLIYSSFLSSVVGGMPALPTSIFTGNNCLDLLSYQSHGTETLVLALYIVYGNVDF